MANKIYNTADSGTGALAPSHHVCQACAALAAVQATANECDAVYCYPGSRTLKNKLGITDADALEAAEREIVFARYADILKDQDSRQFRFSSFAKNPCGAFR